MTWYKTGTVAVTPDSNAVIGTGTSFIANARVGDAFRGPDGEWYEVTNIASNTALSIAPAYQGAAVEAGVYSLAPMQGYVKDSADALRAATQVIASGVADMQEQVAAATEAAASAGQSKTVATEQAVIASDAATLSTGNKEAAQLAAQQSATSAQASGSAADRSETARDSIVQSEQAAAASAAAAAESAEQAEAVTVGKAASGANSDITSINGLTTPLSIRQGGNGALVGERISDANAPLNNGRYLTELIWEGSVFPGNDNRNQGFLTMDNYNSSVAVQTWTYLNNSLPRMIRFRLDGTWLAWVNMNPVSALSWGAIGGTLANQTDLQNALSAKLSGSPQQLATAWVNFDGATGTIRSSFGVASVVRTAVGTYRVTFTTPLLNVNYAPVFVSNVAANTNQGNSPYAFNLQLAYVDVVNRLADTLIDRGLCVLQVFGGR
ncbi:hypothetical protein SAMN04490182_2096 [Pseudomonas cedrina]|uniref:Uncharacterized protein n=2 Tax=Pseudomonas cedrina TaxID=651740 RepID=A0A1V2K0M1_PSECE|nr:hypothetical protein [Pseudomonas cedrina]ONH51000.1 hypothetical protein BLL36_24120 [Pseudomonas cedrina subsp. cedrina]SDS67138.1 hypothetical protein SAMN04490182_2096 [Pseudomonas cedrina]